MQNEIINKIDLLDEEGNIACPGYAKKLLYNYNSENIKAKKSRIKEWDYYYVSDKEKAYLPDDCRYGVRRRAQYQRN